MLYIRLRCFGHAVTLADCMEAADVGGGLQ